MTRGPNSFSDLEWWLGTVEVKEQENEQDVGESCSA